MAVELVKGIDVSKYQTKTDWNILKQAGYKWIIIRVGYQGYGSGGFAEDPLFKRHIDDALAADIPVGLYWICQSITVQEAINAAKYILAILDKYKIPLSKIPLGVWWDNEPTTVYPKGRADKLDKNLRTDIGLAFLDTIASAGLVAGIYTNLQYINHELNFEQFAKYPLWLAQWNAKGPSRECAIWQHGSIKNLPGVVGECDVNVLYDTRLLGEVKPPIANEKIPEGFIPYPAVVTAKNGLNVRAGAGVNFSIRGVLKYNSEIVILKESNGWGRVALRDNYYGWISLNYTKRR